VANIYGDHKTAQDLVRNFITTMVSSKFPSGCICSGEEIKLVRALSANLHRFDFLIVTPGVRFDKSKSGDQARVVHPFSALKDGANYVVIGRELTQSPDPLATWIQWKEEYERTFN
jgi:orotidine-5'-phosphate decarboxylase